MTGWRKLWRANNSVTIFFFFFRISRIPFQVGNSATFPRPFIVINDYFYIKKSDNIVFFIQLLACCRLIWRSQCRFALNNGPIQAILHRWMPARSKDWRVATRYDHLNTRRLTAPSLAQLQNETYMFCASYVYLFNLRWTGFTSPQPIVGRVLHSTSPKDGWTGPWMRRCISHLSSAWRKVRDALESLPLANFNDSVNKILFLFRLLCR